jgi:Transposase DDE domain group 1
MRREPAAGRQAFAVLLVVPVLRHDEFGFKRHHLVKPWRRQGRNYHAREIFDLAAAVLAPDSSSPRSSGRIRCRPKYLYEKVYCARGEMENGIKECQLNLYADRISTNTMQASCAFGSPSMAYVLLCALRRIGLFHAERQSWQHSS